MTARGSVEGSLRPAVERGGLAIHDVGDMPGWRAIEQLQYAVWGNDNGTIVPAHLLALVAHTGGIVLGTFDGSDMVGFAFGLLARDGRGLYHASHMLGIHPRAQGTGIGTALKWGQRARAIDQGLDLMTWTFDPLDSRNAYFNFHKLGAVSQTYRRNMYGAMDDAINRGIPSDRLYVEWKLDGAASAVACHAAAEPVVGILKSVAGRPVLTLPSTATGGTVSIAAPTDIQRLKLEDMDTALEWRRAQRAAFLWAFDHGYIAEDFVDGACVLVSGNEITDQD